MGGCELRGFDRAYFDLVQFVVEIMIFQFLFNSDDYRIDLGFVEIYSLSLD